MAALFLFHIIPFFATDSSALHKGALLPLNGNYPYKNI
jgi:hypothetical protein